jgi:TetR/AcrR family transcriptional repressor of nem operon
MGRIARSAFLLDSIPTGWYVSAVPATKAKPDAKAKLLGAALSVIRGKGYSGTSVDELCAKAGVTKGAFFHHFKSKDELGAAAADYWSQMTAELFAGAPYHEHADPLERVLAYVDFRKALVRGGLPDFTCLVGTMVQEVYETAPAIRDACSRCITGHAATLEADIEAAMRARQMKPGFTARSLALHMQAVIQGSFVLAKAAGGAETAVDSMDHLRRYIELTFGVGSGVTKRPIKRRSNMKHRTQRAS